MTNNSVAVKRSGRIRARAITKNPDLISVAEDTLPVVATTDNSSDNNTDKYIDKTARQSSSSSSPSVADETKNPGHVISASNPSRRGRSGGPLPTLEEIYLQFRNVVSVATSGPRRSEAAPAKAPIQADKVPPLVVLVDTANTAETLLTAATQVVVAKPKTARRGKPVKAAPAPEAVEETSPVVVTQPIVEKSESSLTFAKFAPDRKGKVIAVQDTWVSSEFDSEPESGSETSAVVITAQLTVRESQTVLKPETSASRNQKSRAFIHRMNEPATVTLNGSENRAVAAVHLVVESKQSIEPSTTVVPPCHGHQVETVYSTTVSEVEMNSSPFDLVSVAERAAQIHPTADVNSSVEDPILGPALVSNIITTEAPPTPLKEWISSRSTSPPTENGKACHPLKASPIRPSQKATAPNDVCHPYLSCVPSPTSLPSSIRSLFPQAKPSLSSKATEIATVQQQQHHEENSSMKVVPQELSLLSSSMSSNNSTASKKTSLTETCLNVPFENVAAAAGPLLQAVATATTEISGSDQFILDIVTVPAPPSSHLPSVPDTATLLPLAQSGEQQALINLDSDLTATAPATNVPQIVGKRRRTSVSCLASARSGDGNEDEDHNDDNPHSTSRARTDIWSVRMIAVKDNNGQGFTQKFLSPGATTARLYLAQVRGKDGGILPSHSSLPSPTTTPSTLNGVIIPPPERDVDLDKKWECYHAQREQALESLYGQWKDAEMATLAQREQSQHLAEEAYTTTFENTVTPSTLPPLTNLGLFPWIEMTMSRLLRDHKLSSGPDCHPLSHLIYWMPRTPPVIGYDQRGWGGPQLQFSIIPVWKTGTAADGPLISDHPVLTFPFPTKSTSSSGNSGNQAIAHISSGHSSSSTYLLTDTDIEMMDTSFSSAVIGKKRYEHYKFHLRTDQVARWLHISTQDLVAFLALAHPIELMHLNTYINFRRELMAYCELMPFTQVWAREKLDLLSNSHQHELFTKLRYLDQERQRILFLNLDSSIRRRRKVYPFWSDLNMSCPLFICMDPNDHPRLATKVFDDEDNRREFSSLLQVWSEYQVQIPAEQDFYRNPERWFQTLEEPIERSTKGHHHPCASVEEMAETLWRDYADLKCEEVKRQLFRKSHGSVIKDEQSVVIPLDLRHHYKCPTRVPFGTNGVDFGTVRPDADLSSRITEVEVESWRHELDSILTWHRSTLTEKDRTFEGAIMMSKGRKSPWYELDPREEVNKLWTEPAVMRTLHHSVGQEMEAERTLQEEAVKTAVRQQHSFLIWLQEQERDQKEQNITLGNRSVDLSEQQQQQQQQQGQPSGRDSRTQGQQLFTQDQQQHQLSPSFWLPVQGQQAFGQVQQQQPYYVNVGTATTSSQLQQFSQSPLPWSLSSHSSLSAIPSSGT
ncbi:hypothetical protein BGZ83_000222 [Gryganskiella cystojenkinii]|nr:hypothetical protein BGZ83_000222 [Gryganskiella cystojenkinii]